MRLIPSLSDRLPWPGLLVVLLIGCAPSPPSTGDLRALAAKVEAAIAAKDLSFFQGQALTQHVECTREVMNPDGVGGPVCQHVGQQYEGFVLSYWRSEGNIVPVDEAMRELPKLWDAALPAATDTYGDGKLRVYALGADSMALTAMVPRPPEFTGSGPLRVVLVMRWHRQAGRYQLSSLMLAHVLAEEFLKPTPEAEQSMGGWERY